jgi:hypothetical protein
MLEEHTVRFFGVALIRAMLGRRSVALVFRPAEAINSSALRHRIKRGGLRFLRRVSLVRILTILPFEVDPRFGELACDWIYDPQIWDLQRPHISKETPLSKTVKAKSEGRRIVVAVGAQNHGKGFDYFVQLWIDRPELREAFCFVAAGKVVQSLGAASNAFEAAGGVLVNRFLEDEELLSLYGCADVIWSCYAPSYDQASGIFGRAVQFGMPVIVRQGSYLERIGRSLEHPLIVLPWGDEGGGAARLAQANSQRASCPEERVARARTLSLARLGEAFGVPLIVVEG